MLAFRDFDTLYETSDEQNFRYFSLYFQLAKFSKNLPSICMYEVNRP